MRFPLNGRRSDIFLLWSSTNLWPQGRNRQKRVALHRIFKSWGWWQTKNWANISTDFEAFRSKYSSVSFSEWRALIRTFRILLYSETTERDRNRKMHNQYCLGSNAQPTMHSVLCHRGGLRLTKKIQIKQKYYQAITPSNYIPRNIEIHDYSNTTRDIFLHIFLLCIWMSFIQPIQLRTHVISYFFTLVRSAKMSIEGSGTFVFCLRTH